jgi:hypothetical protein
MLGNSLGHPPLSVKFRLAMEATLDLLGERIGRRLAAREHLSADLAETLGEKP